MKPILYNLIAALLLSSASSDCFALQSNKEVTPDEAKKLGVVIRSNNNGEDGIKVWIEFAPQGELKNFIHVEIQIRAGDKCLIAAPLLTSNPTNEGVSAFFSTDASNLPLSVLTIVVQESPRTRIGYQFNVKEFLNLEKPR